MKYLSYPEMKETEVDWEDKIPKHWKIVKLRYILNIIQTGTTPSTKNEDYFYGEIDWFTPEDFNDNYILKESNRKLSKYAISEGEAKTFPPNTVLLVGIGATIGKIGIIKKTASFNQQITGLFTDKSKILPKYILYWFLSKKGLIKAYANFTTLPIINNDELKSIKCIKPPIEEQKEIVRFLDQETKKIDQLIEKKEKLIELLEEKRQAIISKSVTKGLDPDVPMKDSGIDWLREIPEHWEVMRLKYLVLLNPSKNEIDEIDKKQNVTFLPMEKINTDGTIENNNVKEFNSVENGFTYFRDGDIILAKITPCFENGKMALVTNLKNGIGFGTTELHVLRTKKNIESKFVYYVLRGNGFKKIGETEMTGAAGQKRVSKEFIENYSQGIPPLQEQKSIVSFLDQEIDKIDNLKNKIQEQISNLKEYRKALITNAVTGKIDVRDMVEEEGLNDNAS